MISLQTTFILKGLRHWTTEGIAEDIRDAASLMNGTDLISSRPSWTRRPDDSWYALRGKTPCVIQDSNTHTHTHWDSCSFLATYSHKVSWLCELTLYFPPIHFVFAPLLHSEVAGSCCWSLSQLSVGRRQTGCFTLDKLTAYPSVSCLGPISEYVFRP